MEVRHQRFGDRVTVGRCGIDDGVDLPGRVDDGGLVRFRIPTR